MATTNPETPVVAAEPVAQPTKKKATAKAAAIQEKTNEFQYLGSFVMDGAVARKVANKPVGLAGYPVLIRNSVTKVPVGVMAVTDPGLFDGAVKALGYEAKDKIEAVRPHECNFQTRLKMAQVLCSQKDADLNRQTLCQTLGFTVDAVTKSLR